MASIDQKHLDDLKKIAEDRGGYCLSKKYKGSSSNLSWKCKEGHVWQATPSNIKKGTWCTICIKKANGIKARKYSIDQLDIIAKEKGGRCLSSEYVNNKAKLKFECPKGHIFEKVLRQILLGEWCPECGGKINEKICRMHFEHVFQAKFPSKKPSWLKTASGMSLELDGYNEELGIAFEHQGEQHYRFIPYFHKNKAGLKKRLEIDKLKQKLCLKHKVSLFIIPEIGALTPISQLLEVIQNEAKRLQVNLPTQNAPLKIDWDLLFNRTEIEELRVIANLNKGNLISKSYEGGHSKLLWECEEKHQWHATPASIKMGTWCKICSSKKSNLKNKKSLDDIAGFIEKKGGKCLSDSYHDNHTKLLVDCGKGHKWLINWSNLQSGKWCPECSGKNIKSLSYLSDLAIQHGGKVLDPSYLGMRHKYTWQCKEGHQWKCIPGNVLKGNWCQLCLGRKKTLEDLKLVAKKNKGECLSTEYLGVTFKYLWRCQKGHEWQASAKPILSRGVWCPNCSRKTGTIADLQKIAKQKGGKCHSKVYKGVASKYSWECKLGHKWEAIGRNIKQGQWCAKCSYAERKQDK